MAKTVSLYIVRHGETEFNLETRAQGWCDSPLTASGRAIAARLGKGLKDIDFVCAWSSALGRAKDTAGIILENAEKDIELYIDEDLKEWGLGSLEGQIIGKAPWIGSEEKAAKDGYENRIDIIELSRLYIAMDGAKNVEPFEAFIERLGNSLRNISEKAESGESNILVVSHGMAILGMIYALTKDKYVPKFILNASVTLIEYTDGVFDIERVNDTSYID